MAFIIIFSLTTPDKRWNSYIYTFYIYVFTTIDFILHDTFQIGKSLAFNPKLCTTIKINTNLDYIRRVIKNIRQIKKNIRV